MNAKQLTDSLDRFGQLLPHIVAGVQPSDAQWNPADGAWSIIETVCHLGDEEEFDFRVRLQSIFEDPGRPWPPIDPQGWATQRQYNSRDLTDSVTRFVQLRRNSVTWLRSLDTPDWSLAYTHPKLGFVHAGDIFAAWVAHDSLHLRQIAKRFFQLTQRDAGEYSTRYAGDWTA